MLSELGRPVSPWNGRWYPGCSVLEVGAMIPQGNAERARPAHCLPARRHQGQHPGREGQASGGRAASEALVDAQGAAGDVLQLPGHVVGHADAVVCQHLQHQPQVQPPLLPGHAVPAAGRDRGQGTSLARARTGIAPPPLNPGPCPAPDMRGPWQWWPSGACTQDEFSTRDRVGSLCTRT